MLDVLDTPPHHHPELQLTKSIIQTTEYEVITENIFLTLLKGLISRHPDDLEEIEEEVDDIQVEIE